MSVSDRVLFQGAWYSFEQCGVLLRDAVLLYENGSHATTVGLAMLARGEMGKGRMLLDLWRGVVNKGRKVSADEIRDQFKDHKAKQGKAQISQTSRWSGDTEVAKLNRASMMGNPDVAGREAARRELDRLDKKRRKRTPDDRHKARMRTLYVDLNESGTGWSTPVETPDDARAHLEDAANDYGLLWVRLQGTEAARVKRDDPNLAAAKDAWPERPTLPEPVRPKFP
jgi:AbiV family abortive infection protein